MPGSYEVALALRGMHIYVPACLLLRRRAVALVSFNVCHRLRVNLRLKPC